MSIPELTWIFPFVSGTKPPTCEGHSTYVKGGRLHVLGGSASEGQTLSLIAIYDVVQKSWSTAKTTGEIPPARTGAASVLHKSSFFIFGGLSADLGWLNDFYVLNTETLIWKQINATGGPSCRDKLACVERNGSIYFFGGFGPLPDNTVSNSSNDQVTQVKNETDNKTATAEEETSEKKTTEHSTKEDEAKQQTKEEANITHEGEEKVETEGEEKVETGEEEEEEEEAEEEEEDLEEEEEEEEDKEELNSEPSAQFTWFDEMFAYDINENQWTLLKTSGERPSGRAAHQMTCHQDTFFVFGGRDSQNRTNQLYTFNIETMTWKQRHPQGVLPSARAMHKCISLPNSPYMVLTGGIDHLQKPLNDLHLYHYENDSWVQPVITNPFLFGPHYHHSLDLMSLNQKESEVILKSVFTLSRSKDTSTLSPSLSSSSSNSTLNSPIKSVSSGSIPSPNAQTTSEASGGSAQLTLSQEKRKREADEADEADDSTKKQKVNKEKEEDGMKEKQFLIIFGGSFDITQSGLGRYNDVHLMEVSLDQVISSH